MPVVSGGVAIAGEIACGGGSGEIARGGGVGKDSVCVWCHAMPEVEAKLLTKNGWGGAYLQPHLLLQSFGPPNVHILRCVQVPDVCYLDRSLSKGHAFQ